MKERLFDHNIYSSLSGGKGTDPGAFFEKDMTQNHFQVFSDENNQIQIVITGASAIAAATAVAECSTRKEPDSGDFLINYGSCAGRKNIPVGTVSLCNKLTQTVDGRTFYPDILYRHPFEEAELYSFPAVQDRESFQQFLDKDAGAGTEEKRSWWIWRLLQYIRQETITMHRTRCCFSR